MADQTHEMTETNARLKEASLMLFGDKAELRAIRPHEAHASNKNARFMQKSSFDQLVENVKQDSMLSSVPLVWEREPDDLMIISGHHRLEAAGRAGVKWVMVLVWKGALSESRRFAMQLSHNAITGIDDKAALADIWKSVKAMGDSLYSGLDSDLVAELEKINYSAFSVPKIPTETLTFWFLPEEIEDLELLFSKIGDSLNGRNHVWVAPMGKYEDLITMIIAAKTKMGIKNHAVAFMALIEMLKETFDSGEAQKWLENKAEGVGG